MVFKASVETPPGSGSGSGSDSQDSRLGRGIDGDWDWDWDRHGDGDPKVDKSRTGQENRDQGGKGPDTECNDGGVVTIQ